MAELVLTEEEKAAATYLEWDNAALGQMAKKMAKIIHDNYGDESAIATGAALLLINRARHANLGMIVADLKNSTFTHDNGVVEQTGDWEVVVRDVNQLPSTPEEIQYSPRMKPLEPDATDLRNAGIVHLKPCPFCGSSSATASGYINERTKIIKYQVGCPVCFTLVMFTDTDREVARAGAIERWNMRVGGYCY